jgi:hypothetical protein
MAGQVKSMVRIGEFKKAAAEKLRALFPQVSEWQESLDATVGDQTVDVLVRFRMGQGPGAQDTDL